MVKFIYRIVEIFINLFYGRVGFIGEISKNSCGISTNNDISNACFLYTIRKSKSELADSNKKQDIDSIVLSFEHPQTNQKYKIVNAYELYQNYKDKVESNPKHSQLEIYNEEVIKQVYSDCFENGEYLHMADPVLNVAPDRLTENQKLSEKIDREETENIIKEALLKSSDLITSENETTVCVFPSTNVNASMITVI
ncbi:hypothetical protein MKX79_13645 [Viridibacillus sp. FSL R5-0468]|uniref:hypothetical protein n=1 Tax=Viridibacillus sp. FSL R5-0468 TaxID=2921640 RepID=UPI0030F773B4